MKNKTESKILEILEKSKEELKSYQIENKLEEMRYLVTPNTVAKNLKRMTEEGKIIRKAKGKPWYYHYELNENYQQK